MAKLFFSYCHKDENLRDELEIHLTMLKRQNIIDTWHDRCIKPGDEFDSQINSNLENANIILLLVSHYFLASDYCYNIELKRAIEKHEEGTAVVVPVILSPCDWHDASFGKFLASTKDALPITKFPDINDGFLETVQAIKLAVKKTSQHNTTPSVVESSISEPTIVDTLRSSNLRIKKEFTDQDRDTFLTETFEYIGKYFEGSLKELQKRYDTITTTFRQVDSNTFTSVIYKDGQTANSCKIRFGNHMFGTTGCITYSNSADSRDNSFNESMSVENNDQSLYLNTLGISMGYNLPANKELSQEGAAEYFWAMLINPLQQ